MTSRSIACACLIALLVTGCGYFVPTRPPSGVGIEKATDGTYSIVLHSCPKSRPMAVKITSNHLEVFWFARRRGTAQGDFDRVPIGRTVADWSIDVDRFSSLDPSTKYFVTIDDPPEPLRGNNFVLDDLKTGLVRADGDMSIDDFKSENLYCSTPTT